MFTSEKKGSAYLDGYALFHSTIQHRKWRAFVGTNISGTRSLGGLSKHTNVVAMRHKK